MRTLIVAAVLGAVLVGPVWAQSGTSVRVEAEVQPSEVGTEEVVTFTLQVHGAPLSAIEVPDSPPTTNLSRHQGSPRTQRHLSFDGEQLTRSATFTWRYRPREAGRARIQPVEVTVRGETYTTDEIRIRVVPQSQRPVLGPSGRTSQSSTSEEGDATDASKLDAQDLFIQTTAATDEAYENEQVTVEYRLFYRPGLRLRRSRLAEAWDAPGFWREELEVASRPTPRTRQAYGQNYESIVLKRVALFPARPGTLRVDPLRIDTEVQTNQRPGQLGRVPYRRQYEPVTLASDPLSVVAHPLPPDAPPDFDGAVGQFSLNTQMDADSVEAGESVRLTASVEGTGNLATLAPPRLETPPGFDVHEPSVQTNVDREGEQIGGRKDFAFPLVPHTSGSHTIPPVTFAYFDAETEQYETLRSDPVTLHVTGDAAPRAESLTGEGLPVGDVAGLMEGRPQWVRTSSAPLYRQPWAYAAVLAPVLLAAGALAYRRRTRGASETDRIPHRKAFEAAQHHLSMARRHLHEGAVQNFYGAVERGVLTFLGLRLGVAVPGITRAVIDRHLTRHEVPAANREAVHELLDTCEKAQFTPAQPSRNSMEATLHRAQRLLLRLDDTLPVQPGEEAA